MPTYSEGDKVRYKALGGLDSKTSATVGIIREVRTSPINLMGRHIAASKDDPRYEIENEHTHKTSAIKETSIIGPVEE
ncbi:DUF2945 domain-containing protein [Aspergillus melleus]|uniref:DUF2945 domain-containing protein n=1 Tax=Aspergillus melleus TaxID=138277 RepID=UPI001E8DBF24|nr:uncharacterized protein LDX57_004604 [Aspergillus melleus]KAH8426878.1 hypothetical protein LDX57_004604 [Aspergillus melleus]